MRYWGITTGVALGAALALSLGLTSWPIDPRFLRHDLDAALGSVETAGPATLTLLPRPTLRFRDMRLRFGDGALSASAAQAEVTLRFDRLFLGAFAPMGLALRDADIHIDVESGQRALAALARPPLSQLTVKGGSVEIKSNKGAWSTRVELGSAEVEWASGGGALRAAASGRWRSQPVEASAEIDAPLVASHGGASAVRAALDAPLAQLRAAGDWSPSGGLDGAVFRGQVSALAPSLTRFARWLGRTPPGPAPAGLEFAARVTADVSQTKLADVSLTLGGQLFEGDLDFLRAPDGLSVSGTLAADTLDLEALIGPPPELLDPSGGWSRTPALPSPVPGLNLDLRVSATRAVWRGESIENAAAAVSQRDGRFAIKLLDAAFAQGTLSGEMSIEDAHGACDSKLSFALENADLGGLLADFGERNFAGQGGAKLSVRARGRSPADIVATADGEGALEIADGVLRSLNFEEALRRGQRRLIDVARDMNAGVTHFGAAHGKVEISDGEARFVNVSTQSPGVSLSLDGVADLTGQMWNARVTARQTSDDGAPTPDGARLDFALRGPWRGPVFAPVSAPAD